MHYCIVGSWFLVCLLFVLLLVGRWLLNRIHNNLNLYTVSESKWEIFRKLPISNLKSKSLSIPDNFWPRPVLVIVKNVEPFHLRRDILTWASYLSHYNKALLQQDDAFILVILFFNCSLIFSLLSEFLNGFCLFRYCSNVMENVFSH